MTRSVKPSVWIEKRKAASGYVTYRVRSELNGKRLPDIVCGPNKAHATEVRDRVRTDLWSGRLGIFKKPAAMPLGQFVEEVLDYARAHKAASTVKNFEEPALRSLVAYFGADRDVASFEREDLEEWKLAQLDSGLGPQTVGMRIRSVKSALSHGVRLKMLQTNPAAGVISPKTEVAGRVLVGSEIQQLLDRLPSITSRAVWFDLNTGLRLAELLASDWRFVAWQGVPAGAPWPMQVVGKGGRTRLVHLHAAAQAVVGAPQESGPLLPRVTRHMIHSHLVVATRALALGRVRFHDLRHTWATEYMRRTGDLPGLMLEGGWSTLEAVKVYQHLSRGRAGAGAAVDYGVSPPILPPNAGLDGSDETRKAQ